MHGALITMVIGFAFMPLTLHADALAPTTTPTTFNQKWDLLRAQGKKISPACASFRALAKQKNVFLDSTPQQNPPAPKAQSPTANKTSPNAASVTAAAQTNNNSPAAAAPKTLTTDSKSSPTDNVKFSRQQLLDTAEVLSKWPGFPAAQVQAYQLILNERNPPVDLNQKDFVDGFNSFENCDYNDTLLLALRLKDNLNNSDLAPEDREKMVKALKSFLFNISDKPGFMLKTAVSISLARYLSENHLDESLAKKDRQIRSLQEHSKFQIRNLNQQIQSDSSPSAQTIWNEMHESEKLRMDLARILFFP